MANIERRKHQPPRTPSYVKATGQDGQLPDELLNLIIRDTRHEALYARPWMPPSVQQYITDEIYKRAERLRVRRPIP